MSSQTSGPFTRAGGDPCANVRPLVIVTQPAVRAVNVRRVIADMRSSSVLPASQETQSSSSIDGNFRNVQHGEKRSGTGDLLAADPGVSWFLKHRAHQAANRGSFDSF